MKKILNIVYTLVLLLVILVAGAAFLSSFNTPLKIRLFVVQSGSMVPVLPVGSVVAVVPQDNYQKDDIVTIRSERSSKETVTHRIVEVISDDAGDKFKLKGDANEDPDSELVTKNRIIGKVKFNVPYFGYIVGFAQTQAGFVVLIVIPATLIIYSEVMNIKNEVVKIYKTRKKDNKKGHKKDEEDEN